jgi:DNA replication licensing factor MCM4
MDACFCFEDIERMVSMKGMIIRSSSIIPEIREAIFRCLVCGFCSDPVPVERGSYMSHFR